MPASEQPVQPPRPPDEFDMVGFIMRYEDGAVTEDEMVAGFQRLIDSGMAFQLQGSYGRTAHDLIASGHCTARKVKP